MVYCDIYITDVTLLQWSHVRNAMTDHLKFVHHFLLHIHWLPH